MLRVLSRRAVLATLVVLATGSGSASMAEPPVDKGLRVIVNIENPATSISRQELARVFLGKKTLWDSGSRMAPAMLEEGEPALRDFIEKDVQRSLDQYRAYWKHQIFSGGGTAPRTFRTPAQVLEYVAREPGGIGLVVAPKPDDRVKVIEVTGTR